MIRIRSLAFAAILALATGCSREPTATVNPEVFAGAWRSTTPSYEHLRLTVQPLSGFSDHLNMRITFSGVAWEGLGKVEGDSLMMVASSSSQSGTQVVAHPQGDALRVRVQSDAAQPITLTFVRGE